MTRFLLEWVVTASLLILVVIALRALLGRRISAGLRYALWAVALVRLLVPLQFFSLPVPTVLPEVDKGAITANVAPDTTVPIQEGPVEGPTITAPQPSGVVVDHDVNITPSVVTFDVMRLWSVLGWLWLAGATVMTAVFFLSNLTFALRLRRVRIPLEDADCPLPVYLAENLPSPCLFGLAHPTVYVTPEATDNPVMLRHVLAHEYTHYRHREYIWNTLRSIALAVHWWNPLVWLAVILSRRDCELACDEGALKRLGDGERIAYGRTLLALLTEKPRPSDLLTCATTMTGGQKSVFDRVARIARVPKRWFWAAAVAVVAMALACVCAFGRAEFVEPSDPVDEFALTYTMDEPGTVLVEGLGDTHVVWSRGTNGGALEFDGVEFCCPKLAGEKVTGVAGWYDVEKSILSVGLNVKDDLGTDIRFIISFTVDMNNSIVLRQVFRSEIVGETLELTDQEMVDIAHALVKPLAEAENYYQSHSEALYSQPVLELPNVFADVLRGKSKFVLYKNEPPISIDEVPAIIDPYDSFMCLQRYAVVDLLGDGTPELLTYVCGVAGDMAGYLLLWDEDGQVHGEIFDRHSWRNRWFSDLKTDGTFLCSDALGVGWESISRLRLTAADGWTLYSEAVHRSSESPYNDGNGFSLEDLESLMVIERDCSDEEFQEALEGQRAKPDATWYELPLKGFDGDPATTAPDLTDTVPVYVLDEDGVRQEGDFSNSVQLVVSDGKRLTLVMREPPNKQNGNSLRIYDEFQVFDGDTLIQTITQDDVIRNDSYLFEGFLVYYGSLTVQDVSFDGAEDFGVVCGSTYNGPQCWFVWNQAAGQFRFSFFSSWDLRVDRDKNQLTDVWRNGNVGTDYYIYEFNDHGDRVQIDHYFEAIR